MENVKTLPLKTKLFDTFRAVFRLPVFEQLLVRTGAGKKVNSFGYRLIPRIYSYPHPCWRIKKTGGLTFKLDISNFVDHAFYFGIGDPGLERLKRIIQKDWVILDVGANIGTTALTFSTLAAAGRVIAFEPNSKNFSRLSENVQLNQAKNISLHQTGLGDREDRVKLFIVEESNPGMNRILKEAAMSNVYESETILIKKLDDFIITENLVKVDLIKIDVEGFEFNVLKGAQRILDEFRPVLFIELNDSHLKENGSSANELMGFLREKGYKIHAAEKFELILPDSIVHSWHFDILCIPDVLSDRR